MITGFLRFLEGGYEKEDDLKTAMEGLKIPGDGYSIADDGNSVKGEIFLVTKGFLHEFCILARVFVENEELQFWGSAIMECVD